MGLKAKMPLTMTVNNTTLKFKSRVKATKTVTPKGIFQHKRFTSPILKHL